MKRWQFYVAVRLGALCVVLSGTLVSISYLNLRLQTELEERQAKLNGSILSPQAQQVAGNVLQEMGAIATTNELMRALLLKHGYTLKGEAAESPTTKASGSGGEK